MANSDFLRIRYGGGLQASGFSPATSPEVLAAIGMIVVQWSGLYEWVEFQVRFLVNFPSVPESVRNKPIGNAATNQIGQLRKLGQYVYKEQRQGEALTEFNKIIGRIHNVRHDRDRLVHGLFCEADNTDPGQITVHHKKKKTSYSLAQLNDIGREIGLCHGHLIEFDRWANWEIQAEEFDKLPPIEGLPDIDDQPNSDEPEPKGWKLHDIKDFGSCP